MSVYSGGSYVAEAISRDLLEHEWVTSVSVVEYGASPAVFTVTAHTGERFTVTVEQVPQR
jgi:hypothetical protein